ncbi:hypothetical protein C7B76_11685 [filamentous cyanobacterium CCP2]|nr:hypothetical protein C7B76_11685 [filamentous cyanobacterium CCP2]
MLPSAIQNLNSQIYFFLSREKIYQFEEQVTDRLGTPFLPNLWDFFKLTANLPNHPDNRSLRWKE